MGMYRPASASQMGSRPSFTTLANAKPLGTVHYDRSKRASWREFSIAPMLQPLRTNRKVLEFELTRVTASPPGLRWCSGAYGALLPIAVTETEYAMFVTEPLPGRR